MPGNLSNEEFRYRALKLILFDWFTDRSPKPVLSSQNGHDQAPDRQTADDDLPDVDRPIWEALGIDSDWGPEESAPEVDEQRLEAFVLEELSPAQNDEILHLLARYQSWFVAWQKVSQHFNHGRDY